jgi:L-ascorbate metabolism protein UlaG (beta-lactamase superfamily)
MNMRKNQIILAAIAITMISLLPHTASAQRSKPDEVKTDKGLLTIQPIQHGSLVLTWDNKVIYIDPYGGDKAFNGIAVPDMIVITDIHGDHMNVETLQALSTSKAIMVVPKAVADQLPEVYKKQLVIIDNDEKINRMGIGITAIPMYNLPEASDSRHPKGRGNGYILNFGGKNVYISGDTEDIPEMRRLKNIDVAFVCMNGPTMDINQAASAVLDFKPKIVYPFHHRGSDIEAFQKLVNEGNSSIKVRLRNWYPEY